MTDFRRIVDWAKATYPIDQFDSKKDWIQTVKDNFLSSGHFWKKDMGDQLSDYWNTHKEDHKEDLGDYKEPTLDEFTTKRDQLEYHATTTNAQFTPVKLARFAHTNKPYTRKVLQQLLREGKVRRIKRGVYQSA